MEKWEKEKEEVTENNKRTESKNQRKNKVCTESNWEAKKEEGVRLIIKSIYQAHAESVANLLLVINSSKL